MEENYRDFIGVFDSGVGGISVLKECTRLLPAEKFVYYGDSAHAPYGERTREEVQRLTMAALDPLVERGVKALVVACNTATSSAIELLRSRYSIPVIGVEPALKPAVQAGHRHILVMATPITLKLEKFHRLEARFDDEAEVIALPCAGLADRIERGNLDAPDLMEFLHRLLDAQMKSADCVVLGCTHYPFIREQIRQAVGDIPFYDGGAGTARELKRRLSELDQLAPENAEGRVTFLSSRDTAEQLALYHKFFATEI